MKCQAHIVQLSESALKLEIHPHPTPQSPHSCNHTEIKSGDLKEQSHKNLN